MARPATVITIIATALDAELQNRGIFGIGRTECEEIMTKVFERVAEAARLIEPREANRIN